MKPRMMLFIAAAVSTTLPAVGSAQWRAVPAGARVQLLVENRSVSANASRTSLVQGLLVRTGDTLGVATSDRTSAVLIPFSAVQGLAISKGLPSRQRSVMMGAISGMVVGALFAGSLNMAPLRGKGVSTRDLFTAGAYAGTIAGVTWGASAQREHWNWLTRR